MTAATPYPPRPGLHPEPSQKPAQACATHGVVGMVLPCPFCGAPPRVVTVPSGKFYGCQTPTCLAQGGLHPIEAWNTRAPAAEPAVANKRHPHADVAFMSVVNAQQELAGLFISADQERRVRRFERWLQQAKDALRPPTAPLSVAFWLGSDAS